MAGNEIRTLSGGINQLGVRAHNERLLLSMIQRHGALTGSDLAKHAGLSSQTVSVILRRLEKDGLLERGPPQRGRVGKPSIPMALAPDGVFTIGLKIGRRTADFLLVDLVGDVRQHYQLTYPYPLPDQVIAFLHDGLRRIEDELSAELVGRIAGIGIAEPYEIWKWHETVNAPRDAFAVWETTDLRAEIADFTDLPVQIENDATAASRAEQFFGRGSEFRDYAYFFIGSFIGGGVVLNNSVFDGPHRNAGAFGSLPILGPDGRERQLLDGASIHVLESALREAGEDPERIWTQPQDWSGIDALLDPWIASTADFLARGVLTVCSVIDFEAVLIDGAFPPDIRDRLVAATIAELPNRDSRGLVMPQIETGSIGGIARALGAACAPLVSKYLLDAHAPSAVN